MGKTGHGAYRNLYYLCDFAVNLKSSPNKYQFSSVAQSCPTLCNPMNHSTPGLPVHHQLHSWSPPKPMSTESVMPSNHLILCCPLLLLPSIFPSIRVFSNESTPCIRCLHDTNKYRPRRAKDGENMLLIVRNLQYTGKKKHMIRVMCLSCHGNTVVGPR